MHRLLDAPIRPMSLDHPQDKDDTSWPRLSRVSITWVNWVRPSWLGPKLMSQPQPRLSLVRTCQPPSKLKQLTFN